ncbi:MAG: hypothetical protein AAFY88_18415, partial [Acidobacteriota bacterium]
AWSPLGTGIAPGEQVLAFAVYDDGSGPALYMGGDFDAVDGVTVNNIARWDGSSWSALGAPGAEGISGVVRSLAAFDGGLGGSQLYVGGNLVSAGGQAAARIARWNGVGWSSPPTGPAQPEGPVYALEVFDFGDGPRLVAGSSAGTPGSGTGSFLTAFDGFSWAEPVAEQPDGFIYALEPFTRPGGAQLVAGGDFLAVGERAINHIAAIDGGDLEPLSAARPHLGVSTEITDFALFDAGAGPELYAAGPRTAGDAATAGLARRVGDTWTAVVDGQGRRPDSSGPFPTRLTTFDDGAGAALVAVGATLEGPGAVGVTEVLSWDGATWTELGELTGSFEGVAAFDDGGGPALFAIGDLSFPGSATPVRMARWDGAAWSTELTDLQVGGVLRVIEVFGPTLYLGGDFDQIDGVPTGGLASWDGQAWTGFEPLVTSGAEPGVYAITRFDDGGGDALYIAGRFDSANGVQLRNVARWDEGTGKWRPLGAGVVGPQPNASFARAIQGLTTDVERSLYLGGEFTLAGTLSSPSLARWDGNAWSALGAESVTLPSSVSALLAVEDVDGSSLMIGGSFEVVDDIVSRSIAEFRLQPEIFSDGFESG